MIDTVPTLKEPVKENEMANLCYNNNNNNYNNNNNTSCLEVISLRLTRDIFVMAV